MTELLISWCVTSSILLAVFLLLRGTLFRKLSPRVRYALWIVVLLKLFIMFAVLRVFFFRPALADCETDAEKSQAVIENLIK